MKKFKSLKTWQKILIVLIILIIIIVLINQILKARGSSIGSLQSSTIKEGTTY